MASDHFSDGVAGGSSSNGASNGAANGSSNGSSNGIPLDLKDAMFWQNPLEEGFAGGITTHPPLPSHKMHGDAAAQLIGELAQLHAQDKRENWKYQSWYLRWFYTTRAEAAQRELEDVVAEVSNTTRRYALLLSEENALSPASRDAATRVAREAPTESPGIAGATLDSLLVRARHDFTDAAATAAIYVDTTAEFGQPELDENAPATEASKPPLPGGFISPVRVEQALDNAAPKLDEIAGMYHLRYPKAEWEGEPGEQAPGLRGWFTRLTATFLPLAPFILGLMVALCLGSVSGLVDLDALARQPDAVGIAKFVLSVLLGGTIVLVLGKGVEAIMRILFDHLATFRLPNEPSPAFTVEGRKAWSPAPRRRKGVVIVALLALTLFAGAEMVAEGTGLSILNKIRVSNTSKQEQIRYEADPIPEFMFYLVGLLISGAYLFYKGSDIWRRSELEAFSPWLQFKRQEWIEEKRASSQVSRLFQLAYLIEQMEAHANRLSAKLDNARAAAVSEAELLHAMLEWIVNAREAMPTPTLHVIETFDNKNPRENAKSTATS